ncbi:hypothetical protein [Thalassospira lucentensis]|uniref:DUF7931 domain-containing protein n=1 Tax=Thalassospira lucentensis TaxID=168935 RepID=UPI003AA89997
MDAYTKKVRLVALERDGKPIYNSSLDHAAILSAAMFEHASNEVCILTGKLDAKVYGREGVVENARIFLSRPDRKIRVLVEHLEEVDQKDHPFTKEFSDNSDVEIRALNVDQHKVPFHFIVMDRDSYRFEKDKNVPSAVAAFGDSKGGENLTRIFDEMWKCSGTA